MTRIRIKADACIEYICSTVPGSLSKSLPAAILSQKVHSFFTMASPSQHEEDGRLQQVDGQMMIDNIVGASTRQAYIGDSLAFVKWCIINKPRWVTAPMKEFLTDATIRGANSSTIKTGFIELIQNSGEVPVMNLEMVSAQGFMSYLQGLRHRVSCERLSNSSYGNKRSSLFNLFRLHNGLGFPKSFEQELGNLMKGFYRIIANERQEGLGEVREGKDPMTYELYRLVCQWFIDLGTDDGIWAHLFLVLTWNLMCRVNNTGKLCFCHLEWADDSLRIFFANTKSDQAGSQAKYPRHLYANPEDSVVCPIFALAMYLTRFNTKVESNDRLFPGREQYKRFSVVFKECLRNHETKLTSLGIRLEDLGSHSIRKGAATFISSCPGGPPAGAISVRGGWSMGKVKDVYIRYEQGGDMFVGRALCGLPLLSAKFSTSPAVFDMTTGENFSDGVTSSWITYAKDVVFSMHTTTSINGNIGEHCLASLVFHSDVVQSWDECHTIRSSTLFRVLEIGLARAVPHARVMYPWQDDALGCVFTGIPPHVTLLHEMRSFHGRFDGLVNEFEARLVAQLDQRQIDGGHVSETRMMQLIQQGTAELQKAINRVVENSNWEKSDQGNKERHEHKGSRFQANETMGLATGHRHEVGPLVRPQKYKLHIYDGMFHLLPKSWRFTSVGPLDMWLQWWLGDAARGIPPLRLLRGKDVKHLDSLVDHVGKRKSSKTLCDLRFLMEYIEAKVKSVGKWNSHSHSVGSFIDMYNSVVNDYLVIRDDGPHGHDRRDPVLKWQTLVFLIRRRVQRHQKN